jgi:hypothetical protein
MAQRHRLPAGGALAVDRDPFARAVTERLRAHPLIFVENQEVTEPARRRPLDHRHRPADQRAPGRKHPRRHRGRGAGLLRRHRPDRPCRQHRHGRGLDAVALRQGRDRREQRAYINCPMTKRRVRGLHRRPAGRRKDRVPRRRNRGLFRRLPADRGDGRTRPRNPAPRPDEAGRPDQRPQARPEALCRGAAAPRQQAGHALQHRGLPDQDEVRRANRCFQNDSRASGRMPALRALAAFTATPSSTRPRCWTTRCG